ncbi:E3 SUMO-protein ligase ZBED1-like [Tachysurus ichikawai]
MASGEVRLQYEEAPASFKSVVWRHFGFAVEYNAEEEKTSEKHTMFFLFVELGGERDSSEEINTGTKMA